MSTCLPTARRPFLFFWTLYGESILQTKEIIEAGVRAWAGVGQPEGSVAVYRLLNFTLFDSLRMPL